MTNYTEKTENGAFICSAYEDGGKYYFADNQETAETEVLYDAQTVSYSDTEGWIDESGNQLKWVD